MSLFGNIGHFLGGLADKVIPGDQSGWHRPQPKKQQPQYDLGQFLHDHFGPHGTPNQPPPPIKIQVPQIHIPKIVSDVAHSVADPIARGGQTLGKLQENQFQGKHNKIDTRQFISDAASTGLNFAPIGTGVKLAKAGTKIAIKEGAKLGAKVGAAQGGVEAYRNKQNLPQAAKSVVTGAALGAAGGAAIPAGGAVVKGVAKDIKLGAPALRNQHGYIGGPSAEGAKGRQYFEKSDQKAGVSTKGVARLTQGETVPLGDVYKHKELKKDYPTFFGEGPGGVKIKLTPSNELKAHYDPQTSTIHINPQAIPDVTSLNGKTTLVHEVQHAIDNYEGRPSGTSPKAVERQMMHPELRKATDTINTYQEGYNALKSNLRDGHLTKEEFSSDPIVQEYKKAQAVTKKIAAPQPIQVHEAYQADPGEQLANAAELRHGLSQRQIDKNPLTINVEKPTVRMPQGISAKAEGFNSKQYVKQLTQAQKGARKADGGGLKGKLGSFLQEAKTKLVDSNAPIEDVLNAAQKKGAKAATDNNITYQIDRVLRAPTIAGQFVKDNGLEGVIKSAPNLDELNQYLVARHGQDLRINEIQTGRNGAADDALVQQLGPKYEPLAQQVTAYSQKLLDYVADKGLISKDLAAQLKEQYPNYVPMNRIFNEGELKTSGTGKGVASLSSQSVVQRLKGSDRQVENPLESLLAKTRDAFRQGEQNDAAKMLASYKDLPDNPFGLKEITGETIGNRHAVSYLDNGVRRTFETSKEIAEAAKSMNREQLGLVAKIFAVPIRVLRLGATGVNMPFVASNVVRDQATAFINSNKALSTSIANPVNFLRAMYNALGHRKEYENLIRQGAGGTSFDLGRDQVAKTVKQIRATRNPASNVLYTVTHPAQLLRAVEDTIGRSEELGRIQQFTGTRNALLREGKSPEEADILAAHAARNNTANFARFGDYGKVLNSILPYVNAGIQGSRVFVRNAKTRPVQTGAKLALTVFGPQAAVTAWNLSDPARKAAYDNIPDFEKEGNLIVIPPDPTQDEKGRWNVIKVPFSQEVAALASVVRNGVEAASGDKGFDLAAMAGNLIGAGTSFNPAKPRELAGQLTPQALKPGLETMTNTNLFTGNQIVPQSLKDYPAGKQYKPDTSGTAVKIGQALGVSPLYVQNAIATATAGAGQQALNVSDKVLAASGAIQPGQVGGQDAVDTTVAKFGKARGTSQDQLDYQKKKADLQAKNAGISPKKLVEAGLEPAGPGQQRDGSTVTAPKAPKEQYQKALDNFNKNQSAYTDAKRDKATKDLNVLKTKSDYPQEVVDMYGMSKTELRDFVRQNPAKSDLLSQVFDLDSKLHQQLGYKTSKFKNTLVALKGGSKRKGRAAKRSKLSSPPLLRLKKLAVVKFPSFKSPKAKRVAFHIPNGKGSTKKISLKV